ncbi:Leptomycin B resistance protein pmd1 [Paramyrothecium foliicola]|nr:Leptomycin B resistance protein pmd1 [Paramyrothecium foliicola]
MGTRGEKATRDDNGGNNDEPKEEPEAMGSYWRIFRYGDKTDYAMQIVATACAMGSGVGMAMVNLVFGQFITVITDYTTGKSTPEDFRSDASRLALYFFIIGLGRFVVAYGYSALFTLAAYRISRNIRHEYLKAGLSQDIAYFDSGVGGSISMQATSNGKLIQAGISEKLGLVIQGLSAFIAAFVLAFVTNWKLTLITGCIAPVTIIVMIIASSFEAAFEIKILNWNAKAGSFAESVLASARTVQAFGLRSRLVKNLDEYLVESVKLGRKKNPILGLLFSSEYFIMFAGVGLCFWQAIGMLSRGEVKEAGDVFTVLMSVIIAAASLTAITPYLIDFTRAATAAAELFRLMDRKSIIDPLNESGEKPSDIQGNIEFRNVCFSYPMRPDTKVLDNYTLHFPAGKTTALVGASGSGKSTIVGLLERWYNPASGSITLDGRPIDSLNLQWLRQQVRLVQQEPILFSGSVFDNIANGLVGTPWEHKSRDEKLVRVQEAAKIAFAHEFVTNLPDGYDTIIGERGGLLSGGQKQRVAIARSIISQPRILLLDEATSALDPHAEHVVQQALDNVSKGRTTITIAHKLATIRNADNIVVMKQGWIAEQGTHTSLLAAGGAYARLVQAQDLTVAVAEEEPRTSSSSDVTLEQQEKPQELANALTRYSTHTQTRINNMVERDSYDNWEHVGFLATVKRLLQSAPELNLYFFTLMVSCFLAAAAYPGQAILMSKFIDVFQVTGSEMRRKGNFIALMFLVMGIGAFFVYFAIGWCSNVVATRFGHKLRRELVDHLLKQDLKFFDRPENTTGALTSRTDSYPQAIFELMGFTIALILTSVVSVLSCSILALAYGWRLGVVIVFAGLPPMLLAGYARIRMDSAMDIKISKRFAASASIASEAIMAIRTVSSLSIEKSVLERYTDELDHANVDSRKAVLLIMLPFAFTQSVEYWFMALGFWYGCRLVSFGDLTMVNFFIAFLAVFFSGQQASILFGFSSSMTKAVNAANYMFWISQLEPSIKETPENSGCGPTNHALLELDHVQFSYPLRPQTKVLRGVDLSVRQGQFAAFVGASGCGKSTMIAMLERFYDPVSGHMKLDGIPVDQMNPWLFRRDVALVQQEPVLYPGTIRKNILLGAPEEQAETMTEDDIINACRSANAWDFISSLPEGLNTQCGANGTQLSGGQRQRIAIARALIRNPKILLLDEATSALDTQSERIVQEALNKAAASGERITIAVAHRLSTIRHADVICVFHGGRIVEQGTHQELIALGGVYTKMLMALGVLIRDTVCGGAEVGCDRQSPCSRCHRLSDTCTYSLGYKSRPKRDRKPPGALPGPGQVAEKIDYIADKVDKLCVLFEDASLARSEHGTAGSRGSTAPTPDDNEAGTDTAAETSWQVDEDDEYRGDSSLSAHASFTTRVLETALASDLRLAQRKDVDVLMHNIAKPNVDLALVSGHDAHSISQTNSSSGRRAWQKSLPPVQLTLNCLRTLKENALLRIFWSTAFENLGQVTEQLLSLYSIEREPTPPELVITYVGLHSLFSQCSMVARNEDSKKVYGAEAETCRENLDAVLAHLPLHLPVTVECILAMTLAAEYCMGQCKANLAWTYVSIASRMSQALGLHRIACLKESEFEPENRQKSKLFWSLYILEKNLSMQLGRSSTLRDHDITMPLEDVRLSSQWGNSLRTVSPNWLRLAQVEGRIYDELYSPRALSQPIEARNACARHLVAEVERMTKISDLRDAKFLQERRRNVGPNVDDVLTRCDQISRLSTLCLIYRSISVGSLAFCDECIAMARQALKEHSETMNQIDLNDVHLFDICINWALVSSTCVPFFVILCHAVWTLNMADVQFLGSLIQSLEASKRQLSISVSHLLKTFKPLHGAAARYIELKTGDVSETIDQPVSFEAIYGGMAPEVAPDMFPMQWPTFSTLDSLDQMNPFIRKFEEPEVQTDIFTPLGSSFREPKIPDMDLPLETPDSRQQSTTTAVDIEAQHAQLGAIQRRGARTANPDQDLAARHHHFRRRNIARNIVALNVLTYSALIQKNHQLPYTTSPEFLEFGNRLTTGEMDLSDWLMEASDYGFEIKLSEYVDSLSDNDVDACLTNLSTSEYYDKLVDGDHRMYRVSVEHSALAARAQNLQIPRRFECGDYQTYLGAAVEEELGNRNMLKATFKRAKNLVSSIKSAMEDGSLDVETVARLKIKLEGLQAYYPDAYEAIHGNRQDLFEPDSQQWWNPPDGAAAIEIVNIYSNLNFVIPTCCVLLCIPAFMAWQRSPTEVGSLVDSDFYELLTSFAMQTLSLGTMLWPGLPGTKLAPLPQIYSKVLAVVSIASTAASVPMYLWVSSGWGPVFSFFGSVAQAFILLQVMYGFSRSA